MLTWESTMSMPSVHLLLVEDNPGDIRLAQEALREARFQNTMDVVGDGEQALAYLRREEPYGGCRAPDILLLDMNLPRMDGFEVLEEIGRDPDLRGLPVVVLAAGRVDEELMKKHKIPADLLKNLKPVHPRQVHIEQSQNVWSPAPAVRLLTAQVG